MDICHSRVNLYEDGGSRKPRVAQEGGTLNNQKGEVSRESCGFRCLVSSGATHTLKHQKGEEC